MNIKYILALFLLIPKIILADSTLFDQAEKHFKSKKYDSALVEFKGYLKDNIFNTDSEETIKAHFYIGDIYSIKGDFRMANSFFYSKQFGVASREYRKIIKKYSNWEHLSEVHLKLGIALYLKKEIKESKKVLSNLIEQYSKSNSAEKAKLILKENYKKGLEKELAEISKFNKFGDDKKGSIKILRSKIRVYVIPDGTVSKVDLLKSSGSPALDNMSIENAKQNKYDPIVLKPAEDKNKIRTNDIEIEFSQKK